MLRTVLWFAHFGYVLVQSVPRLNYFKRKRNRMDRDEYDRRVAAYAKKWAARQMRLGDARIHISGLNNIPEGPVLFVSNHQSNFDVPIIIAITDKPKGFVAKIEMLKVPILREWMPLLNCVFIDRSDTRQSLKAILDGIKILKSGYSMTVFPEGTRSKGGPVGEFKAGSFKMATKAKCPIVPITMDGTYHFLEEHGRIRSGDAYVTIHPPISTVNLTTEQEAALPNQVRDIIISAMQSNESKIGKELVNI